MQIISSRIWIFNILYCLFLSANGQDINYTKNCLNKLASEEFHGRGYTQKGEKIAAKFISNELKKHKIKAFKNSYYQYFKIDINTIQSSYLKADNKKLILGKDYLVYPASSSSKGNYELYYPTNFSLSKFNRIDKDKFIFVLDTIHYKSKELIDNYRSIIETCGYNKASGIVEITNQRLIQIHAQYQLEFPYFQIDVKKWDESTKTLDINLKTQLKKSYQSQNIIGYIEGKTDSLIVFSAHYDHIGRIGKNTYFPGANDNGSGVAYVLDLMKHYAELKQPPKYTIAFMFFGAEEVGLLGSNYYVKNPLFSLTKIKFLFNLDMVGTGSEGICLVNSKANPKATKLIEDINQEKEYFDHIQLRGEAANSDHHYFHQSGVPAIFIYTKGGPQFYHDIYDRPETLPLTKHNELISLLIELSQKI